MADRPMTTRFRPRVGRWFINFNPGPRATILEWDWSWWEFRRLLPCHFGRLNGKPHVLRWRIGPLILDRYRMEATHAH